MTALISSCSPRTAESGSFRSTKKSLRTTISNGSPTQIPSKREKKKNGQRHKHSKRKTSWWAIGWLLDLETNYISSSSPWVFDRLIPVSCQVVIESCKGTFFKTDVVSLKNEILTLWEVKVLRYFNSIFQLTNHLALFAGQAGNLISDHSQLSGKLVRETISLLSMKLLSSSSPEVLKRSHFYSFIVTSRTIYNHLPSIVRDSYCEPVWGHPPSSQLSFFLFPCSSAGKPQNRLYQR